MNDLSIFWLLIILFALIIFSAFFSSSETSMMAINRYRIKHLSNKNHKVATRIDKMLNNSDNLLSTILLGNNFVNILASAIATIIGIRLWGDAGIAIATGVLTFVILVFAEITPKTIAAYKPETIAFPASFLLQIIIFLLKPIVAALNVITSSLLKLTGIDPNTPSVDKLTKDEIRTVLIESKKLIRESHYKMLLGLIDLENLTVEDIMIPQHEIFGIDINASPADISQTIINAKHTRLPVYNKKIKHIIGIAHLKELMPLIYQGNINRKTVAQVTQEPMFIPANSLLDEQLKIMQKQKIRVALIVNEYGDLQGLITMEDILEEIIGNFTTDDISDLNQEIVSQTDGSYLVDCGIAVRELNHELNLNLPIYHHNTKTLNGLISHELEDIAQPGTSIKIAGVTVEIISTKDTVVETAKIKF